ncbi:BTAD domain-containing putative transcriptional regulator [Kocuria sp. M4R2S49]|uniref:BTAD domain-containing putative transcriptional regulator n=1 Tax=Kocuria rhizosphaericola TaxID=3376284 RepID=UPI00378A2952
MTGREDVPHGPGPPCADGLVRERLVRRLDAVLSARLGLVVAPHGTGKTTLLAHWAAHRPEPLVWHRVDPADAHPERLLAGLAGEVATLLNGPEPRGTAELASLAARAGRPLLIVLDDVHLIAGTPAETELERLLLLSPPNVHLLAAGRRAPSFNLARPEFSSVVLVDGDDLRFRVDEADALFRDVYGRPLEPAQLLDLVRTTDGWAAALHLYHLHAMNRSPVERHRAACTAGAHYAWDYLRHHVLEDLSAQEHELLQLASMFDVVTPRRCDGLLGTAGTASPVLHELGRRSLLSADDVVGGLRMPEVVRRFFAEELRDGTEFDRYAVLRGRAVSLLERDGDLGNALELLAADSRWDEARRLLERSGAAALAPGSCGWAERLPAGMAGTDSWFGLADARRLFDDGRFGAAHAAACRVLEQSEDRVGAELAVQLRDRSAVWASPDRISAPAAQTEQEPALRTATRRDPAAVARALGPDPHGVDLLAAGIAWLLAGDRRAALPLLRRCAQHLEQDRLSALAAQLVLALFESGEPSPATDAASGEMEAVHRHARCDGFSWLARLSEGMLAALSGDPAGSELAEAVVRECERRGDDWGAALLHAATVLAGGRGGGFCEDGAAVLAGRFRALHADVLAAWATTLAPRPAAVGDPPPGARALTGGALPVPGGPAVEVACFGGLAVRLGTGPVDLGAVRPRARTVLRLLALHSGRPVHREWLAGILWEDLEGPRALHNLQVCISALRAVLHTPEDRDGRRAIVRQGNSYVLFPDPGSWCDLAEFDRFLHEAGAARRRGDLAQAEAALQGAVELYSGDVLPEEGPADWLLETRDRYRLRAAQAAGALARTRSSLGRGEAAVAAAVRSVEINPWSDDSWRLLIELLRDTGEVAEAERTRRRYRHMLDSLGIVPGPG